MYWMSDCWWWCLRCGDGGCEEVLIVLMEIGVGGLGIAWLRRWRYQPCLEEA